MKLINPIILQLGCAGGAPGRSVRELAAMDRTGRVPGNRHRWTGWGFWGMNSDRQSEADGGLTHGDLTREILGCAFEVMKELGAGFLESVYERALLVALRQKGLSAQSQHPVRVMFRGECVGDFYADLLVEEQVMVELKAVKAIAPEHQAQVINYLNATGVEVGLLNRLWQPAARIQALDEK